MKIDYQAQLCTAFLAIRTSEDDKGASFAPMATAFFIGESLSEDRAIKYIVTARHVIDQARRHGSLWMRCISPDGKRKAMYEFPVDAWWVHPTTDVAVAPLAIALEDFGLRWLPLELLATEDWLREQDVGIGDHIVASGLFSQYPGISRDEPMMRFGRISLIPKEPLRIRSNGPLPSMEFEAILAELAAWGGQSGSPAFVYFSIDRHLFAGAQIELKKPSPRLLGLIHGHYVIPERMEITASDPSEAHIRHNSGIAIIIPAYTILEVLFTEEATEHRSLFVSILKDEGLL
jgi:hypothetical protein